MVKRKSSLISKLVIGITLLVLSLITLKVPIYSQPRPLNVVTEADLKNEVIYDAWVEFKDKDIGSEKQRLKILKDLEKSFCC